MIETSLAQVLTRDGAAARISRGVIRLMEGLGYAAVAEFGLANGRRADVFAVDSGGKILIVEIKSCRADFMTDRKWQDYLEFCDRFYFAVEPDFPRDILPAEAGLIIADAHGGAILRDVQPVVLNGNRRRSLILNLALTASRRLARYEDGEI